MARNGKELLIEQKSQDAPQPESSRPTNTGHSLIGPGISVEGTVTGKGDLVIGGTTKGDIHLNGYQVSIEKDGNVEAEIQAESALIKGTFRGNLTVNGLVKIEETAYFEGDLKAARLHLEDGAKLKGVIDLHTD